MHITGSRDLNFMNKVVKISPYGSLELQASNHSGTLRTVLVHIDVRSILKKRLLLRYIHHFKSD